MCVILLYVINLNIQDPFPVCAATFIAVVYSANKNIKLYDELFDTIELFLEKTTDKMEAWTKNP